MRKFTFIILLLMIVGVSLLIVQIGCKQDDDPAGPSDYAHNYSSEPYTDVTLTYQPAQTESNGDDYIVFVNLKHNYNRGAPASEITVTLTTSLGSFDRNEQLWSIKLTSTRYVENGEDTLSTYLYYTGVTGYAVVNAQTDHGDGAKPIYPPFGDGTTGSPYKINMIEANPSTICGNGNDSSVITVELTQNDVPLQNASISVATTMGCLSPASLIVTDTSGRASVTLRSDSVDSNIRAMLSFTYSSGGTSETLYLFITVEGPGWDLDLTSDGQLQYPTVTAYLTTCNGGNAPDGERITLTTSQGTFIDGSQEITLSTVGGRASVRLTADENVTTHVEARYDAYNCDGTTLSRSFYDDIFVDIFKAGETPTPTPEPYVINLQIADSEIGGDARHFTAVTATVTNSSRPVNGLSIKFEADNGGCFNPEYVITNSAGMATSTLQSGLALTQDRQTYVTASHTDELDITYSSDRGSVIFEAPGFTLKAAPGQDPVNVGSSTTITAHLSDYDDVALENENIVFTVEGSRGSFSMGEDLTEETKPTDANGDASVLITSNEAGPVTVKVTYNTTDCDGTTGGALAKTLEITFN